MEVLGEGEWAGEGVAHCEGRGEKEAEAEGVGVGGRGEGVELRVGSSGGEGVEEGQCRAKWGVSVGGGVGGGVRVGGSRDGEALALLDPPPPPP